MLGVFSNTWALMLGMLMLMLGNGLHGTLLGVRGGIEGFSTFDISVVMAGYALGFLGGSRLAPVMIQRVGHVRVFAALASFISAILIVLPLLPHPVTWTILRVGIGFCFSGVYVTAESWLNNSVNNEMRGKALSLYLIVQMAGIVIAQGVFAYGNPEGYTLFIIASVIVSISFAPILLSVSPAPTFEATKPMSFRELFRVSPLGCVAILFLGGVFAALFGMGAVYGTEAGLSIVQISMFITSIYLGGLIFQFPIGWLSDRMDRRTLIIGAGVTGASVALLGVAFASNQFFLLSCGFLIGGVSNPLYGLILAYTNDFLEFDAMPAAAGGMIFINGFGAVIGPIIAGQMMSGFGPSGFFLFIALMMCGIAGYGFYRSTQRPAITVDETASYVPVSPSATTVVVDAAVELAIETAQNEEMQTNEPEQEN